MRCPAWRQPRSRSSRPSAATRGTTLSRCRAASRCPSARARRTSTGSLPAGSRPSARRWWRVATCSNPIGKTAPPVALVNQAFARRFLNGANPIGRTVMIGKNFGMKPTPPREIVGVVADAVYRSLREPVPPTIYVPLAQFDEGRRPAPPTMAISVRPVVGHAGAARTQRQRGHRRREQGSRAHLPAARRSGGRLPHAGACRRDAGRLLRRAGAAARRAGTVWRHVVRRQPPPDGDRHPHGARRRAGEASSASCCRASRCSSGSACWSAPASASGRRSSSRRCSTASSRAIR